TLAMGMLLGSLVGIQVGALTTKVVKGIYIRGFYAVAILAGFINRAATLPRKLVDLDVIQLPMGFVVGLEYVGNVLFWFAVGLFGLWIFSKFFANLKTFRQEA
ncbi:MAG: sulfite exporter TauE/SafE family protein, partial [Desulfocurvibacter africanus]